MTDPRHKALLALYGAMLRLYPANFRREFGQEMLAAFGDAIDERGPVAALSLLISDFVPSLLHEHLEDSSGVVFAIRALLCAFPPLALYAAAIARVGKMEELL